MKASNQRWLAYCATATGMRPAIGAVLVIPSVTATQVVTLLSKQLKRDLITEQNVPPDLVTYGVVSACFMVLREKLEEYERAAEALLERD